MRIRITLLLAACVAAFSATPATAGPLRTGIADPQFLGSSDPSVQAASFAKVRAVGASFVRIVIHWNGVAPARLPASWSPMNPADPAYDWSGVDDKIRNATQRGLAPILTIIAAPSWAERGTAGPAGTRKPNPTMFGQFAEAAARRYSGSFGGLPRVRYWMAWNEPNRDYFLMPQVSGGRIVSGSHYRYMVNAFSVGVKRASSTNVVVAGGLAPLGRRNKPAPLAFMRAMLCVSRTHTRTCNLRANPVRLDVWSHHPYTSGGPTHSAQGRDDVALGDLPQMRRLLHAAVRLGHVRPRSRVGFWVTEFSWDSRPPDPQALSSGLHARWVSEALYRMWRNGVGVVVWYRIQDDPMTVSHYQSGFYTANGTRKTASWTAFRFPTVALRRGRGVYVWGRTPTGRAASVAIELKTGRRWRRLGTLRASSSGMFSRTFRTSARTGYVRARIGRSVSVPFSLRYARDRYVNPFGCGGAIRC